MGNLFEKIPDANGGELFSELVRGDNVRIERIVSKGHASPEFGWYDQQEHEWVVVLKGEAKVSFENGREIHLATGDYINIPAREKHKVDWTTPDTETIWLAVFYK